MNRNFLFLLLIPLFIPAQDSLKKTPLTLSGYAEVYYTYDLGKPASHQLPSFLYNFTRHNEVNVNLGYIKANYNKEKVRGNLALMVGTYSQYNLSSEHPVFQHLLEGNVGIKISETNNLWIDAGVMGSHLGFESAVGKDNFTLTRSLFAENSPYYESGVKLTYTSKNEKFQIAGLFLNGWQHIQRLDYNQTPAAGTQFVFKQNKNFTLNWSTFVGNEKPDTAKQWRYFNDVYAVMQFSEKFGALAGFDIGVEQKAMDSTGYNFWYSPTLIIHYKLNSKNRISLRGEYFNDEKGVIIVTGTPNGFQTAGYSINYDYYPDESVIVRLEARALNSKDKIFMLQNAPSGESYFFTASLSYSF